MLVVMLYGVAVGSLVDFLTLLLPSLLGDNGDDVGLFIGLGAGRCITGRGGIIRLLGHYVIVCCISGNTNYSSFLTILWKMK